MAEGVDDLSGERVRQELWLILLGPRPAATLALMRSAGVLARVVPGAVSLDRLERLAEPDALLRLAALIRPSSAARVEALADRLRLSNHERERLQALVATAMPDFVAGEPAQRLAIHRLGPRLYADLVRLGQAAGDIGDAVADELLALAADWRPRELPIGGADLLALGVPPGPELGRMLADVRRAWEEADFTLDREACLARAAALAAATRRHLTP